MSSNLHGFYASTSAPVLIIPCASAEGIATKFALSVQDWLCCQDFRANPGHYIQTIIN
ncbi:MAG: hypothetical protein HRT36_03745 [Alphaproteobacteria bacterium]|nr:hypothetical protein [Alphaproteobacteria bacterium]